ncbi:sensor domain-containing diguanylate cyclase [Enterovibrio sp. ZSDZ42]|uniref:Sensor domain-containing diguanylate cyclase n=1 Tax=Enterovibrio gelatinilyticus TaxID=2899819 RepID=A0ABT5R2E5_9GAMM|nr:sensor domain-containing diguanylate cyclase [Enterovibrio sp. ZSDZ42]MDD1794035.1 sensor domain-containing diguanylate cyclase [Enterovibrio sp. ZSDZ42]
MSKRNLNLTLFALCISMLTISLGYTVKQTDYIEKLNEDWHIESQEQVNVALELAALERAFGYLGFIHHFKNYVLRRTDYYYIEATESYWKANDALLNLFLADLSETHMKDLIVVQSTLNEYFQMLNLIYVEYKYEPAVEVDKLVKVDDNESRKALTRLRADLETKVSLKYTSINESNQKNQFWLYVSSSFPLVVILALALSVSIIARRFFYRLQETDAIFNSSPDGCIYVDDQGRILRTNHAVTTIFGYNEKELMGMEIESLMDESLREAHVKYREDFSEAVRMRRMSNSSTEVTGLSKSGDTMPLSVTIASFQHNKTHRNIAIVRDLSHHKKLEKESQYDLLTNLRNRRSMEQLFGVEVKRAKRYGRNLSVLLIDIDHFKELNDSEGHTAGDEGLVMTADHLRNVFRKVDHIGRWGGDEFMVVCPELSAEEAECLADRVCMSFSKLPYSWDCRITMSIGIASMSPNRASGSVETLFKEADKALYAAKAQGRNRQQHFRSLRRPKLVN